MMAHLRDRHVFDVGDGACRLPAVAAHLRERNGRRDRRSLVAAQAEAVRPPARHPLVVGEFVRGTVRGYPRGRVELAVLDLGGDYRFAERKREQDETPK